VNFLAHVYLSGSNMQLAIGNLIADRIKGKKINLLTPEIRAGVILHRDIDHFTDHHHIFRECVNKLFPKYRHYSRVIVDMYLDHFLALNWAYFHTIPLNDYSNNFYKELERKSPEFTDDIQKFIKALIKYNWFKYYGSLSGLQDILNQMEKRTKFPSNLAASIQELKQNYEYFQSHFFQFMKEIIVFTKTKTKDL
jgi:acyl carrier protein phosphodiesterase